MRLGYLWLGAYILTIFAANWLIQHVGIVPVPLTPWQAPAGFYAVGLSFTARDLVQDSLGRRWTVAAILIGAALSFLVAPSFALASGVTFLVSETADFAVYTPLRSRRWLVAVAASNVVGLMIDSALFLWLAFGSLDFLAGQVAGKAEMTVIVLPVVWLLRQRRIAMVTA